MKLKKFVSESGGVTRDYHQIDPRRLQVRPDFNIRDLTTPAAREKLDVLKAQVKAEGILEPLEIEFDGELPWINEGHRRHIVVMELIEEGHDFKTIPCVQERSGADGGKRTLHMLMRSKEDYEPLEYAIGVDRMVNVYGWDRAKLAEHLGFASKASIDQYLEMLAMPDAVKEQVGQGDVSATTALKVVKNLPAGTDPNFAADLIAKNKEENKRLGVGARTKHKATPKTLARDKALPAKPTAKPPQPPKEQGNEAYLNSLSDEERAARATALADAKARERGAAPPLAETTPPTAVHEQLRAVAERERGPQHPEGDVALLTENVTLTLAPAQALPRIDDINKKLFGIVGKFCVVGEDNCIDERADDEMIPVPAALIKEADRIYRSLTGDA